MRCGSQDPLQWAGLPPLAWPPRILPWLGLRSCMCNRKFPCACVTARPTEATQKECDVWFGKSELAAALLAVTWGVPALTHVTVKECGDVSLYKDPLFSFPQF